MRKLPLTIGLLLASLTPALGQDDRAAGEALFAQRCQVCHAIGEGAETASKVGPHLNAIVGAPMAGTQGYTYSPVLLAAGAEGRVWTVTELRRFMNRPKKLFPGTRMSFAGQSDPVDLGNLVAYLASFAADGARIEPTP